MISQLPQLQGGLNRKEIDNMPISGGKYVAPTWQNDGSPAIDATELQAISDSLEEVDARDVTNNTSITSPITGSTNLVTMNTLRYALNRTTGVGSADTGYSTPMMRAIYAGTSDLTAGSSTLTSGRIYLVYE